ncbi:hypothetical protein [Chloroflexus sp.]|uniref:hypothetical protein n=1 Tax=Chloroflexus sp. TaxID=1904827 RepID=UPI002ACED80E|nr:hypothetical protein [Chloroflexus sp.]
MHWRKIGTGIAIGFVLLAVIAVAGWQLLADFFLRLYYETTYQPRRATMADAKPAPLSWKLSNVPWIAADGPLCQSTSLQMIAAQHGHLQPRPAIDLLMSFTYGFMMRPGGNDLIPFGLDPEVGMRNAAPYLGLQRQYYVTDEPDVFIALARSFIAQGYPVRVALDMGALYGSTEFIGHSNVLIGYDEEHFYLYETVCLPPAPCQPGQLPAGEQGIKVSTQQLLDAIASQARTFQYPWRYNLTIFTPTEPATDLRPVWQQLAQTILGASQYGPPSGVAALEQWIDEIEAGRVTPAQIQATMPLAARLRRENAAFLSERFATEPTIAQAASQLAAAATYYEQAAAATEPVQIAALLRHAAAAERAFGEAIRAYAP